MTSSSLTASLQPGLRGSLYRIGKALRHGDIPWAAILIAMALLVLALVAALGWSVWAESAAARKAFGWSFIAPTAASSWDPVNDRFAACRSSPER
jgi:ABC-type phosphate transport system permease subunit